MPNITTASELTPRRSSRSPARKRPPQEEPRTNSKSRSPTRSSTGRLGRPKSSAKTASPARRSSSRTRMVETKSRSPTRSSPHRRGRPKSSAKTTRTASPARRSSSRTRRVEITAEKVKKPLPTTVFSETNIIENLGSEAVQRSSRKATFDLDTDSDSVDVTPQKFRVRSYRTSEEKTTYIDVKSVNNFISPIHFTRSSTLLSSGNQNREIETFYSLPAKKLAEFSDEDDITQKYKKKSKSKSIDSANDFKQVTEFGGTLGVFLFTVLAPLGGIGLFLGCNEIHCSFTKIPPYKKYLQIGTYFNLIAGLGVVTLAVIIAILTALPFGGKKIEGLATKQGKFTYVLNSPFATFFILAIAGGLEFKGIPVANFIVKHIFELFVASYLSGLLLIVWVHMRSFYEPLTLLNAHCLGKNWIYGFFMGRSLNPRLFGLVDLKIYVLRVTSIGTLLLNLVYIYLDFKWITYTDNEVHLRYNPTLLVLVILQSIYALDPVFFEKTWVTTFEVQYEGVGYLSAVGCFIYPFMASSFAKYVFDYNIQLKYWQLALTSLLFVVGYVFSRGSNNQKDAFRKNPYDSAFANMETIPTTKGKKLLCSGFWGIVRHPNYLGDILMSLSFIPFVLVVPPILNALSIVLLLVHRSVRDHTRCKQKYGTAWDRYCQKVKYVLVPKVY